MPAIAICSNESWLVKPKQDDDREHDRSQTRKGSRSSRPAAADRKHPRTGRAPRRSGRERHEHGQFHPPGSPHSGSPSRRNSPGVGSPLPRSHEDEDDHERTGGPPLDALHRRHVMGPARPPRCRSRWRRARLSQLGLHVAEDHRPRPPGSTSSVIPLIVEKPPVGAIRDSSATAASPPSDRPARRCHRVRRPAERRPRQRGLIATATVASPSACVPSRRPTRTTVIAERRSEAMSNRLSGKLMP